jgi:ubiquinone/menaquinone biosynthesis C-methylase UbiE
MFPTIALPQEFQQKWSRKISTGTENAFTTMGTKDNFSRQASVYAQFRPHYPDEMIAHVVSFVQNKNTALDIATGNGQVAQKLAGYFDRVYATDISEKQLENAVKPDNIIYKKEAAEQTDFSNHMFDLITVAQAVHWFEFDAFYNEVYRILKPDGVFAVLGYGLFSTNPDSDVILSDYYHNIVGPYWDAERKYIDKKYEPSHFRLMKSKPKSSAIISRGHSNN